MRRVEGGGGRGEGSSPPLRGAERRAERRADGGKPDGFVHDFFSGFVLGCQAPASLLASRENKNGIGTVYETTPAHHGRPIFGANYRHGRCTMIRRLAS